jgi:hypothetical protein
MRCRYRRNEGAEMSIQVMKVMVPPPIHVPRVAGLIDALAAWWAPRNRREDDLLQLAREVEPEQPSLACELRGIAMHEAAATASRQAAQPESRWRRAGRRVWQQLEAMGRARAERDLLELAARWESTQPELAKELRMACSRAG